MKTDEIIRLLDAGFTKEEILKMDGLDVQPKQEEPEQKQEEQPTPEPEPQKEEPKQDPAADLLKIVAEEFKKLREELISSNITNSNNKVNSPEEPSQILASVVDPDGAIIYNKERK